MTHVTNKQGTKYIPAFCTGKISFKNIPFRTQKSAFKLETKFCGLPSAAMTSGKSKRQNNHVLIGLAVVGSQGTGIEVSTQNNPGVWRMVISPLVWMPGLSPPRGQNERLSQGFPGQSGFPSLLSIYLWQMTCAKGRHVGFHGFFLNSPFWKSWPLPGKERNLGKVRLEITRVYLKIVSNSTHKRKFF